MSDQITVVGNVATAPERRELGGDATVVTFRLATTERRRDAQTGAWVDGHTNWYRVSAFRALGENVLASVNKGERVVVTGRYRLRTWESGGTPGHEAEIDADALGHDLRWGTSVFSRGAGSAGARSAEPAARGEAEHAGDAVALTGGSPVAAGASAWASRPGGDAPF